MNREKSPAELYHQTKAVNKDWGEDLVEKKDFVKSHHKTPRELVEEFPEQYPVYLEILRSLRKSGQEKLEDFLEDEQYCQIKYNLMTALQAMNPEESSLYAHQVDMITDLINHIDKGERTGYIESATSTGKTVVFVEFVKNLINKKEEEPYDQPSESGIKTLVLAPSADLCNQIVGDREANEGKGKKGFAQFAPNIRATKYFDKSKDMSGDVVVMTYASLNAIIRGYEDDGKEEYKEAYDMLMSDHFGAIISDEAHRALGNKIGNNLPRIAGKALKIGFTASPLFTDGRSVKSIFGEKIHELSLLDAVEKNLVADPRMFVIDSKFKVKLKTGGKGDYSEEDLAALDDPERNKIAINIAMDCIMKGKQGLISCVPKNEDGRSCAHAWKVAEELAKQIIIDPKDGKERNVRAQAIDGDMKPEEREEMYKKYSNGEIDFLTFVDTLKEGWDNDKASVLINLRPTLSRVLAAQRLGRILRKQDYKQKEYCDVYDIVDDNFEDRNTEQETQLLVAEILGMEDGDILTSGKAHDGTMSDLKYSGVDTKLHINRKPQQMPDSAEGLCSHDERSVLSQALAVKVLHISRANLQERYQGIRKAGETYYDFDKTIDAMNHYVTNQILEGNVDVNRFLAVTGQDKEEFFAKFKKQSIGTSSLPVAFRLNKLIKISGLSQDEVLEKMGKDEYLGNIFLADITDAAGIGFSYLQKAVAESKLWPKDKADRKDEKGKIEKTPFYDAYQITEMIQKKLIGPAKKLCAF
ncbi:MAG: DEAD/DEAH box helicase family protein [Candidatus Falkowbacteria bacterium]